MANLKAVTHNFTPIIFQEGPSVFPYGKEKQPGFSRSVTWNGLHLDPVVCDSNAGGTLLGLPSNQAWRVDCAMRSRLTPKPFGEKRDCPDSPFWCPFFFLWPPLVPQCLSVHQVNSFSFVIKYILLHRFFFFFKSENLKVLEENLSDLILSEAVQRERREAKKGRMVTSGKGGGETSGYWAKTVAHRGQHFV